MNIESLTLSIFLGSCARSARTSPSTKNPVIARFFREIHRADELGSGMRKMMRYGKSYGDADPEMIEGDVFRIVVKVPEFGTIETKDEATNQVTPPSYPPSNPSSNSVAECVERGGT